MRSSACLAALVSVGGVGVVGSRMRIGVLFFYLTNYQDDSPGEGDQYWYCEVENG